MHPRGKTQRQSENNQGACEMNQRKSDVHLMAKLAHHLQEARGEHVLVAHHRAHRTVVQHDPTLASQSNNRHVSNQLTRRPTLTLTSESIQSMRQHSTNT
jgi:hypothetical protein